MAAGAALEVEIAEKRFDVLPRPLFRDLSLRVAPSSTLVLVGPSGIGKSTLLRLVAGVDHDFGGRILVDDTPASRQRPPGFVFQDPRLLPWLDAVGNIRAVSPSVGRNAAAGLLAQVGLAGFEGALPRELSGGMQRRVGLARALAIRPRLLLLDEPFVSLDPSLADELQGLFLRIIAEYRPTTVLVSHSVRDAARLGDRIVMLAGQPAGIVVDFSPESPRDDRDPQTRRSIETELQGRMEAMR